MIILRRWVWVMNLHHLLKLLKKSYDVQLLNPPAQNLSREFNKIILLKEKPLQWEKHSLYFCKNLELLRKMDASAIIFVTKAPLSVSPGTTLFLIKKSDFDNILSLSQHYLMEDLRAEADAYLLAEQALRSESMSKLINGAASTLGNALILSDSNLNILAYSTNYEIMDPLWQENIRNHACTDAFRRKVSENEQMANWSKHDDDTIVIQLEGDLQPKMVSRVVENGHLIGGITMIEHHSPFQHFHPKLLHRVGMMLFRKLDESFFISGSSSLPSTILHNLLDTSEYNGGTPLPKFDFPGRMQAIVARFLYPTNNRHLKRTVATELEQIFSKGFSFQHKGYVGILVDAITDGQKQKLRNLCPYRDISIGISWPFHQISDFKKHFKQSVQSIKYAEVLLLEDRILDYTDFAYFDMLHQLSENLVLGDYCHPALISLENYDRNNNSDLYCTLYTYLKCDKNLRQTAAMLYIHKNSLAYRLNRIKEITEIDLNHPPTTFALIDSFRIQKYLKSVSNSECQ